MKKIKERDLRRAISSKHIEDACAYIRQNGAQNAAGVWKLTPSTRIGRRVFDENGELFSPMEMLRFAYLFALKDKGEISEDPPFSKTIKEMGEFEALAPNHFLNEIGGYGWLSDYELSTHELNTPKREDSMTEIAKKLLGQFYQIIFHGPPGTGKTRAAKQVLKSIFGLGADDDDGLQKLQGGENGRWDIVQFHPSYNYEDFVRGIQAEAVGGKVAYETVNRTFGEMCASAIKRPNEKFALIIDEINRANVSAVLGELIYALEYRGQPVNTSYAIDGKKELVIPKNLYVIGTMNTADRTIGQIDYAVRRRFAFVACPPDEQVVRDNSDSIALDFFNRVNAIFDEHTSPDFDAADVRVGHSYFLATGHELGYKLVYQVVPILREYVKDGVLQDLATPDIDKIEEDARELFAGKSSADKSDLSDLSAEHIAKVITPEFNEQCDWNSFEPKNQHPISRYAHFYKWKNSKNPRHRDFPNSTPSEGRKVAISHKGFSLSPDCVVEMTRAMLEVFHAHPDFSELWMTLRPPHVPPLPSEPIVVVMNDGTEVQFQSEGKVLWWDTPEKVWPFTYQVVLTALPKRPSPAKRTPQHFPAMFYWRHHDGEAGKTDKIGYCGRDVLLHFVKKNLDKTIEWFKKNLHPQQERVELLAHVPEKHRQGQQKKYFAEPKFQISLKNGDVVVVSNQFGSGNDSWEKFTALMEKFDYSIIAKEK